eukprot:m.308780 g.308780  ORF g.308780 m.308780 type:complete len:382 (+) comp20192_c0_seq3:225-1370(+)
MLQLILSIVCVAASPVTSFLTQLHHTSKGNTSSGCGSKSPVPPGSQYQRQHLNHDGLSREYLVYIPSTYQPTSATPLVLAFHGYHNDARDVLDSGFLMGVAEDNGFIIVAPEGHDDLQANNRGNSTTRTDSLETSRSWNAAGSTLSPGAYGPTCTDWADPDLDLCYISCAARSEGCDRRGCDWTTCARDIEFVNVLVDQLLMELCIATKAVYATGFSNGGMLAYWVAMYSKHRFAAVAPVAGGVSFGFLPAAQDLEHPFAVFDIHGLGDHTMPYNSTGRHESGHLVATSEDGWHFAPREAISTELLKLNKCSHTGSTHYTTAYDGEMDFYCVADGGNTCMHRRASVVRCTWNGPHGWPVGIFHPEFAMRAIWDFFQQHTVL